MVKVTSYGTTPHSVVHPDGSWLGGAVNTVYDNAEFTVANGLTDVDKSSIFSNITTARYCEIRTDQTITVKLNAITNDSITITSSDSPYTFNDLEITTLYVTNASGSTANVKIRLT